MPVIPAQAGTWTKGVILSLHPLLAENKTP